LLTALRQADYILNESPDYALLSWLEKEAGENTTIVQNLCGWEAHDLTAMPNLDAYGKFGFAAADPLTCLPTPRMSAANAKNIEIIRKIYNKI